MANQKKEPDTGLVILGNIDPETGKPIEKKSFEEKFDEDVETNPLDPTEYEKAMEEASAKALATEDLREFERLITKCHGTTTKNYPKVYLMKAIAELRKKIPVKTAVEIERKVAAKMLKMYNKERIKNGLDKLEDK